MSVSVTRHHWREHRLPMRPPSAHHRLLLSWPLPPHISLRPAGNCHTAVNVSPQTFTDPSHPLPGPRVTSSTTPRLPANSRRTSPDTSRHSTPSSSRHASPSTTRLPSPARSRHSSPHLGAACPPDHVLAKGMLTINLAGEDAKGTVQGRANWEAASPTEEAPSCIVAPASGCKVPVWTEPEACAWSQAMHRSLWA